MLQSFICSSLFIVWLLSGENRPDLDPDPVLFSQGIKGACMACSSSHQSLWNYTSFQYWRFWNKVRGKGIKISCNVICKVSRTVKVFSKSQACISVIFRYLYNVITTSVKNHLGNHPTASCEILEINVVSEKLHFSFNSVKISCLRNII